MTLFIEDGAPVIVQGMTGHQGMTHTARMLKAGDIYEDIVKKTGASTATISRIKRCLVYGSGGYEKILSRMAEKDPDFLKLSK